VSGGFILFALGVALMVAAGLGLVMCWYFGDEEKRGP
jgi:hypothetical protein